MKWQGVMPAITTAFDRDYRVDHGFLARHCRWLVERGTTGIVPLGSLGEGATLEYAEKLAVVETCVKAGGKQAPVVASISSLRTKEAVELAKAGEEKGRAGRMSLTQ